MLKFRQTIHGIYILIFRLKDYRWVPKAHLGEYFSDEYYNKIIKAVPHRF